MLFQYIHDPSWSHFGTQYYYLPYHHGSTESEPRIRDRITFVTYDITPGLTASCYATKQQRIKLYNLLTQYRRHVRNQPFEFGLDICRVREPPGPLLFSIGTSLLFDPLAML